MSQPRSSVHLWISTGVLIAAASVIFLHIDDLSMWFDELWAMFQNSRSLSHVLRERELNWPVGHAVMLYGWTRFAGSHDVAAHTLGALLGLLGTAFLIQAGRTLYSVRPAWIKNAVPSKPNSAPNVCAATSCDPAKRVQPYSITACPTGQLSSRSRSTWLKLRLFWNMAHSSSNHIERSSMCKKITLAAAISTPVLIQR